MEHLRNNNKESVLSIVLNSAAPHGCAGLEVFLERGKEMAYDGHTPGHAKESLATTPP